VPYLPERPLDVLRSTARRGEVKGVQTSPPVPLRIYPCWCRIKEDALIAIIEAYKDLDRPLPPVLEKDLKIGTLRHIVRQLGLDWEAFKQA